MIHIAADIALENSFSRLPDSFFSRVLPTPLHNAGLLGFDQQTAAHLGWAPELARDNDFLEWISGERQLPGSQPLATVYAGHQFGVFVPQLGDGRAILLGEVRTTDGELLDVQLKGGGMTPYSRNGDGRSVLRSAVREYLASMAMRGLGIPTTHALALMGSDEPVQRETMEHAALLVRVARSHIRFGHFEYFYYQGREEELKALTDYVLDRHYPECREQPSPVAAMFAEICQRTAQLIARWMAVGFQHGVMNTDNMSITGDTIDYGPYGFMDHFDPSWICNHSDHTGRYAFMQQPSIGLWNLGRLARALTPLAEEQALVSGLESYQTAVSAEHMNLMREKLGLQVPAESDAELLMDLFARLQESNVDYCNFFRDLSDSVRDGDWDRVANRFSEPTGIRAWLERYQQLLPQAGRARAGEQMRSVNPRIILRNHIAQEVIRKLEGGDVNLLNQLSSVLASPCGDWPEHTEWAEDAPDWARHLEISCSS